MCTFGVVVKPAPKQPENSKRAHLIVPAVKNTKIQREDTQKKSENLGGPTEEGPAEGGPEGPNQQQPHQQQQPQPHNSHTTQHTTHTQHTTQHNTKNGLAKVGLAKVGHDRFGVCGSCFLGWCFLFGWCVFCLVGVFFSLCFWGIFYCTPEHHIAFCPIFVHPLFPVIEPIFKKGSFLSVVAL